MTLPTSVSSPGSIPIRLDADIVSCRSIVKQLAQQLKLSVVDQTKLITAASELSRNTLTYGGGGEMRWEAPLDGLRRGVRLHFEDHGPGISDLVQAMTDGWTSGKGMGLGLSGSKRLVHEFEIRTEVGVGTCVSITQWK